MCRGVLVLLVEGPSTVNITGSRAVQATQPQDVALSLDDLTSTTDLHRSANNYHSN